MDYRPPEPARAANVAAWIAPRLRGDFGAVCRTIPTGFAAYARIFHPADPGAPAPLRWSDVARSNGRTMHPNAQFERIASPAPDARLTSPAPDIQPPATGNLAPDQLEALCQNLRCHTPSSTPCWFALWDGWGGLTGDDMPTSFASDGSPPTPPAPPREWQLDLGAAKFELPSRTYYLFTGPVKDALRFGSWVTRDWFLPQSPNLFWPVDRSWIVATEIDFDSTLVAGSADLISDLLHSADLEVCPIDPADSLAWDSDKINRP